jgi:hypothetical protein
MLRRVLLAVVVLSLIAAVLAGCGGSGRPSTPGLAAPAGVSPAFVEKCEGGPVTFSTTPIEGAKVSYVSATLPRIVLNADVATTNSAGKFSTTTPPNTSSSEFAVEISATGYLSQYFTFFIPSGPTIIVVPNVYLEKPITLLSPAQDASLNLGAVVLKWDASLRAASYRVLLLHKGKTVGDFMVTGTPSPPTKISVPKSHFTAGHTYTWSVSAQDKNSNPVGGSPTWKFTIKS